MLVLLPLSIQKTFLHKILTMLVFVFTLFSLVPAYASPETALDDYINAPDPSYNFTLAGPPVPGVGYKLYVIYMASQQWRSPTEVDRTQWTHWMAMVVPDVITTDTGMLIIAGGSNSGTPDIDADEIAAAAQIAVSSHSIVSVLGQVPNQPLYFADEPFAHSEDELVAYTFDKALDTGDWQWPAYLPMTKAAVRAMDTIQSVAAYVSPQPVAQFVVTGFSKRGGITWFTGIVDPRVRAIAPGVFDILNMDEQVDHHFSAYGFYSDALHDFVNYNILRRVRTPEGQSLMQVVDPIAYRERLTMPKFILNSSGDQFFTSDSARFYFDNLEGENLIRYVANTGHTLETIPGNIEDALTSLVSWYLGILYDFPRPQISWTHDGGNLIVQTTLPPLAVRFWSANNPTARDFRLDTIGRSWNYVFLPPAGPGSYSAPVPVPSEGWTAYFVDLIYQGAGGLPQTYSTSIYISPDTLPFAVTDPLGSPYDADFWAKQFRIALGAHGKAIIPADTLAGYFPVPLFDEYINSIEAAAAIFSAQQGDAAVRARRDCLALRLNVRNGQLGWYTSLQVDDEEGDDNDTSARKLWQHYTVAHDAFLAGDPKRAGAICDDLNESGQDQ